MAFAVFFDDSDAAAIAASMNRNDLTPAERRLVQKIRSGGWENWKSAPHGLYRNADLRYCAPDSSRRIVVDGVAKQEFVNLLMQIGTRMGGDDGGYLTSLALDVQAHGEEPA